MEEAVSEVEQKRGSGGGRDTSPPVPNSEPSSPSCHSALQRTLLRKSEGRAPRPSGGCSPEGLGLGRPEIGMAGGARRQISTRRVGGAAGTPASRSAPDRNPPLGARGWGFLRGRGDPAFVGALGFRISKPLERLHLFQPTRLCPWAGLLGAGGYGEREGVGGAGRGLAQHIP